MPSPLKARSTAKAVPHAAPHHDHSNRSFNRAPFGFVFFLLFLVTIFAFSTFYVISQTEREQAARRELAMTASQLDSRVSSLQGQINHLSAQLTIQQDQIERLTPKTGTSMLPTANKK